MNRINKIKDSAADAQRAVDELYEYRYEIGGVAKLLAPSAKRGGRGTISITTNADAVRNKAHVDIFKVETDPTAKRRLEEFYSDYANTELRIVGVRSTYNGSYSESIADPTPNRGWGERNSYDMSSTYAPSEWVINLDVADNSIADSRKIKDAFADYEGNDLDYERMFDRAYDAYDALLDKGAKAVGWRDVANEMGIQMNTLNGDDYELLKSAIEDALIQWDYDNTELNSLYPMYEGMQQYNLPRKESGIEYHGLVKVSPLSRETVYVNRLPKTKDSCARHTVSKKIKDAVMDFDLYEELDAIFSEPDFSGAVYAYRKVDGGVAIEVRKSSYDKMGGSEGVAEMIYNLTGIYVNIVSEKLKEPLAFPSVVELVLTPDSRVYDSKRIKDGVSFDFMGHSYDNEIKKAVFELMDEGEKLSAHNVLEKIGVPIEKFNANVNSLRSLDNAIDEFEKQYKEEKGISDSKRIKDEADTDTDDVIDGILIITFKDGSQEDGLKAVQGHANEQGDGYETYEVKEQDGKVGVDMCAQTSDPNGFVKELLKTWGVLDAVADVDFKKSDLMEEAEQQEEVSDSCKITDSTYGTSFTLTNPVNDYNAASDYLQADDMTQYLNNDLDYLGLSHLEGKIKEIRWVLEDELTGYIVLYTTEPLAEEDLDKISEWISGQCSDGLGEGFEQQDFASGEDFEEYEDEDGYTQYEEVNTMASFDWETNDYKLKLYDSTRKIRDGRATVTEPLKPFTLRIVQQYTPTDKDEHILEEVEDMDYDEVMDYLETHYGDLPWRHFGWGFWYADLNGSSYRADFYRPSSTQANVIGYPTKEQYYRSIGKYADSRIKDGCGEDAESVGKVNNTDILRDNKGGGVYVWVNGKKKKFSTKKDAEAYIKKTFNEDGTPKK